jgi:hypothetical protein
MLEVSKAAATAQEIELVRIAGGSLRLPWRVAMRVPDASPS